jgi:hypothetical protein
LVIACVAFSCLVALIELSTVTRPGTAAYCVQAPYYPAACYWRGHTFDLDTIANGTNLLVYMAIMLVVFALGLTAAIMYARSGRNVWRWALWGSTIFNVLFTYLTPGGIVLVQPSLVLLVAAVFSLGVPSSRRTPEPTQEGAGTGDGEPSRL